MKLFEKAMYRTLLVGVWLSSGTFTLLHFFVRSGDGEYGEYGIHLGPRADNLSEDIEDINP